jgi:glycosyltransferase involved in cell wall biosynthesis
VTSRLEHPQRRLAILATHPVQYQCPLWAKIATRGEFTVRVFFGSDFSIRGYKDKGFDAHLAWNPMILQGFDYVFVGGAQWHPLMFRAPRSLYSALADYGATDMLLNAYLPVFYWQGLRWARRNRARVCFRGDTTDVDRDRNWLVLAARTFALSQIYSRVDTFCAVGQHSRSHYLSRGISPQRIYESPFCVDTDAFERLYQYYRGRRHELRSRWNLAESDFVLVFSGKLIPKKDPLAVIEAVARLPLVEGRVVRLLVAGDGPLRDLCQMRAREMCAQRVTFLGFTTQEDLAKVYTAGDALVLPSTRSETWGLVVNEAMQFGLPCVVSDRVGCIDDLIFTGETGESFGHGDVSALRAAIERLAGWLNNRREVVAASCRNRVSNYSLDAAAAGIVMAVLQEGNARIHNRN